MQRWHKTDCTKPDVVTLADKVPRCQACHSRPQIEQLISSKASTSSVPLVPPDLPSGQMDLWWPRAVPYSTSMTTNSEAGSQHLSAPTAAKEKSEKSSLPAAPYGTTLKSDEFRLIFLEPAETPDSPVHLTLEVYNLDDCPEYEAVSYTWAGENGDNTLSQPIYVGPFWDILLQTKNCWAMLQFMRPLRIPRMIWVDAICINQGDTLERSMQVVNMGNIYSACSRVVVYLGPHIAMPLFDRHPRRRMLHEFETEEIKPCFPNHGSGSQFSPSSLRDILKLRYFSRIWVIQEFLLSQRVVLRIGDIDFWADSTTATHFSLKVPGWDWETTAATWVQFTSQRTSTEMNLGELLEMSSASRSTDPRDRIFGLLGIFPEMETQSPFQRSRTNESLLSIRGEIQADYSLSCQQIFIGFFAFYLLNKDQPNILYRASCLSQSKPGYPTWAPNWESATPWKTLFQEPKLTSDALFKGIKNLPEYLLVDKEGYFLQYRVAFDIYELRGPGSTYIEKERHWRKGAFIDASTASLNVNLTQYMTISRPLERVGTIDELHLFCMRYDCFSVYMVSEKRLDRVLTGRGNEELFILNINGFSIIYLLLRRQTDEHGAVTYKLISACPRVQILILVQRNTSHHIPNFGELRLGDLQCSVYDAIENCRHFLDIKLMDYRLERRDRGILVGITAIRDFVPVLKQLYQQRSQQRSQRDMGLHWPKNVREAKIRRFEHSISEAFIQCVDRKLSPRLDNTYVTISMSTRWEICHIYLFRSTEKHFSDNQHKTWEYRIKDSGPAWESPYLSPSVYDNLLGSSVERRLEIRFPMSWVFQSLFTNPFWRISKLLFKEMDMLSGHFGTIGDDLWSLVVDESELDPDLRFVSLPNHKPFPYAYIQVKDLFAQLGMKMNTCMVCIE
ncbi:unnamed protein product [Clonostachys byssicola]|uniref:Heterokaryon incompatibility domain-containing protein n=1 Tax=Clonostachys byssicola TaxID=160290 RepID=A0A9N9XXK9_9HYPO|nr:unnamed protein product [Clonostachys byssicola]